MYQAGLRFTPNEESVDYKQDEDCDSHEMQNDEDYDFEFAKRRKMIQSTRTRTARFTRISSNKFTISSYDAKEESVIEQEQIKDGMTYLDEVYEYLSSVGIKTDIISKLREYIFCEEFDTDSVNFDVCVNHGKGNIANNVKDRSCLNAIKNKFNKSNRMCCAF